MTYAGLTRLARSWPRLDINRIGLDLMDADVSLVGVGRVVGVKLTLRATDADLEVIAHFADIRDLDLAGSKVNTDAGLVKLRELKRLSSLRLVDTDVTPRGPPKAGGFLARPRHAVDRPRPGRYRCETD